jgi:large subunit ribosomal protein L25
MAMAEIVLNVEVRDRTGTGGARAARREHKVPGVLYGGSKAPVALAVSSNEFRKALYTGKLLGHLVTLNYGKESQPVIAKDVQFHPVTDEPIHFDLYRVDEHQQIRISVPVHFRGQDVSPGLKRGGTLNIVAHDLEVRAAADSIPEEIVVDVSALEIGDSVHMSDLNLPKGVEAVNSDAAFVIATITGASSLEAEAAAEGEAEEGAEAASE